MVVWLVTSRAATARVSMSLRNVARAVSVVAAVSSASRSSISARAVARSSSAGVARVVATAGGEDDVDAFGRERAERRGERGALEACGDDAVGDDHDPARLVHQRVRGLPEVRRTGGAALDERRDVAIAEVDRLAGEQC